MSNKYLTTIFKNGAKVRIKNKQFGFHQVEKSIQLYFRNADCKDPEKPACLHRTHKGKMRETFLCLSEEAMDYLVRSYIEYKQNKLINNIDNE